MSGNKGFLTDLVLLCAFTKMINTAVRAGLPLPISLRKLVTDLANQLRSMKTGLE